MRPQLQHIALHKSAKTITNHLDNQKQQFESTTTKTSEILAMAGLKLPPVAGTRMHDLYVRQDSLSCKNIG